MLPYLFLLLVGVLTTSVSSQSNYANQANNIEYVGDGLPEQATLDGKVTQLDDLSPVIFLNRTKAALNCAQGSMQVELKFNDNFYGIAYADFDRNSACKVAGKGGLSYKLELPLKGCGTRQDPLRVFTNNIVVRFHPGLEIDGDEIITIVCRYPPPIAPPPDPLPGLPLLLPEAQPVAPPLGGFQILLIICAILFLSLLLLGLGCSHYCLRRRNMTVIRRHPFSSIGSESEITKISSSLGNLSMFEGVKIPRAHAPVTATGSSSGSDGPLISDTLPSDYPSESPSEPEDERSIPSAGSYENAGYIPDGSVYSEGYGDAHEERMHSATAGPILSPSRLPMMQAKESPKFDVQIRVKKPPPSPPSLTLSDTESSVSRLDRNLSTIVEQREESVRSIDTADAMQRTQFSYVPELHPPPKHVQVPPTYNKILRRQQEFHEEMPRVAPARSIASLNTEMTDTHSMTEVIDDSHHRFIAPTPPPPPPIIPKQQYVIDSEQPESFEAPISIVHKPEITSHVVDDVFLRTITEKRTIEDIERHKRLITEYHTKSKPVEDIKWDVTIKHYPPDMPQPPDWENFSDISSASGLTLTPKMERANINLPPPSTIHDNKLPLNSPELVGSIGQYSHHHQVESFLSTYKIPLENPNVPNWNVLIRVLQPMEHDDGPVIESAETFNAQLTHADKMKWRQIITTESTLRTMLTEAVVREDYERIRYDSRYEKLFEPPKWEVIIRILAPEKPKRYRKKTDWDTRSRRSSLPTLYEYDSDGGSSIKTLTQDPAVHSNLPSRMRKSSRSSYRSEADLRSMSEMIVDFGRPDQVDSQSEASSYYPRYYEEDQDSEYKGSHHPSLARSLSQPSLARSASEFTERWIAPSRYDTTSEYTTPEGTPKSQRSTKIQPMHVPRGGGGQTSVWQNNTSRVAEGPRGTQVITEEYRAQVASSSTFRGPTKNWFADNDSEASFK